MQDLPHDIAVEQAVLGAMMLSETLRAEALAHVRAEHFADQLHVEIFTTINQLVARGDPVTALTVKPLLPDEGLRRVGGLTYLAGLMTAAAQDGELTVLCGQLADRHLQRRAIALSDIARHSTADVGAILHRELVDLVEASQRRTHGGLPLKAWNELGVVAPADRLVRRLLGTTSLAVMFGEPGSGKSFLAVALALHIALGWEWFGRSVTHGAVLYVAGEGVAGLSNRLAGFRQRHSPPDDAPFYVVPIAINLGPDGTDAERVIAAARSVEKMSGYPVALVVVDTLARAMGGGDENSTLDMGRFIAACDRIKSSTGATVLVVHHKGKNGTAGARGSSALLGAADTVIEIEKREAGRVAKVVKQKDGSESEEIGFDLEVVDLGDDDEGKAITTCVVVAQDQVAKPAPKLTKTEKRALEVLRTVILDHPVAKADPRVSLGNSVAFPDVTLVEIDRFREALKSSGVTDRDNPNNERSQWRRMTISLADKGVFAMRDAFCWACDRA